VANLLTSPDREELRAMSDEDILHLAEGPTTFLGEEFAWIGSERMVRNSVKTVAKLRLAPPCLTPTRANAEDDPLLTFTCQSFVALVSPIRCAHHTTQMNPAHTFVLLRAYRGVYSYVTTGLAVGEERGHPTHCLEGGSHQRDHATHGAPSRGHAEAVPGLYPPADAGGRVGTGTRQPRPPRITDIGVRAPKPEQLGLHLTTLYREIQRLSGVGNAGQSEQLGEPKAWPLHLKHTTLLDISAVQAMTTAHSSTKEFLDAALRYVAPAGEVFCGLQTSRTIKPTSLSMSDIERAVTMRKFERCEHAVNESLRRHRDFLRID